MSRQKGCALFLVFAVTLATVPSAMAQRKRRAPAGDGQPSLSSKRSHKAALPSSGGGADALDHGDKFYNQNNYFAASIEYAKIADEAGGDELSKQTAEFKMGKTLYKMKFYSAALSYFDRIVQKGASHPHYNETLQWLASLTREMPDSAGVLEKIGKYDRAELENTQLATVRDELYFLLGKFNYTKNKFKEAVELFQMVSPKSPFYVQAKLFEGATFVREYNAKPAVAAFKEVLRVAEESSDPKIQPFQDLANLSLARVFYSTKQFVLATKYFDRVSPESYDWPNSLFESSWANFMLQQQGYSKALGNIHTLRAPYFEYFIKPESAAEALTVKATIFYYNCLFNRATDAIEEFLETVPSVKDGLIKVLKDNQDNAQFFDIAVKIRAGKSKLPSSVERAARAVLTDKSLAKRFEYVRELDKELRSHDRADSAWKSTAVANNIFSDIGVNRALMVNEAGEMARKRVERLVEEFKQLHNRVIKIQFEILEGEKKQAEEDIRNESPKDRRVREKEYTVIKVDDEHQYWPFTGEYWRDELGYYRYRLKNKCGGKGGMPEQVAAPDPADTTAAPVDETMPAEGAGESAAPSENPQPDTTMDTPTDTTTDPATAP
jgi:tetratricopeptide (TPR) repeat protein